MRNLSSIKINIDQLKTHFKADSDILSVYIFGSYGTDTQTELSDIDIAVIYNRDMSLMEELRHSADISSILHRDDTDVVNLNNAPVYLQHDIILKGEKIYEKPSLKAQNLIERILDQYHDYGIILKKYRDDYEQNLKEEYLS